MGNIPESIDIIICDNIRMELGGKLSLMGVALNNTIVVPTIPCTLPTLSFLTRMKKCPQDFIITVCITTPAMQKIIPMQKQKMSVPQKNASIFFNFTIAPFRIESEGSYVITVVFENDQVPAFTQTFKIMKAKKRQVLH